MGTAGSRERFRRIDLAPYVPAVQRHDVRRVMPSFSSVDWVEDGVGKPIRMHANRELITGELKRTIGFDGFVISDWQGIHQIPDPDNPDVGGLTPFKVRTAVNAGIDMVMEPNTPKEFLDLLLAEVEAGRVSQARIDDAVRRILHAKFELAGNQAGGWTIEWQGMSGDIIPGTTILEGIREVAPRATVTHSPDASAPMSGADVGVVVVGETPYTEGFGDVGGPEWPFAAPEQQEEKSLSLQPQDRAVIDAVCSAIETCVGLVVSGRPQVLTDQLDIIDALVASWLPGSEGAGVADVLFGKRPFTGRLPITWPRTEAQVPINVGDADYDPLYPYGWGLRAHGRGSGARSPQG